MSFLNQHVENEELKTNDGDYVHYDIPTAKFMSNLANGYFWTCDWETYGLRQTIQTEDGPSSEVVAIARLHLTESTILDLETMHHYCMYIKSVSVRPDLRGLGIFNSLMGLLIHAAEEAGIFLFGYARYFNHEFPVIKTEEEWRDWTYGGEISSHLSSLKEDKKQAKKLYRKYLDMGFCNYSMKGIDMGNRQWKQTAFGYGSTKIEDATLKKHLEHHLKCA